MAEDQAHQRQQNIQRLRIRPAQAVEPARAFPDNQRGNVLRAGASGSRCAPIRENGPASAACACVALTPGRNRAMGTIQS